MKRYSLFILIIICLLLTGCNDKVKEAKGITDFQTVCTNEGFTTHSSMIDYKDYNYILDALKANNENIEIEMISYDTDESAKKVQDQQIDNFMNLKSANAIINKEKGKNFYKYSMISNRYYMVSSRIDNTLLFAKVSLENKDTIDKIFDELGY